MRKLTYVAITPYTLLKSRTGGIIGRILALGRNVRFVGARMYAPSDKMIDAYRETLHAQGLPQPVHEALAEYVDVNLRPDNPFGISNRMMVLLFDGPDPIRSLHEDVVGELSLNVTGNTIRGTYGDFVRRRDKLTFFEPAVLMPTTDQANRRQMKVLSDFALSDGGILTDAVKYADGVNAQTTLVIIKPDNFLRRSSRPGNIIDVFSREGLYIVATKMLQLSPEAAERFYGPLRTIFVEKLKRQVADRARAGMASVFGFHISPEAAGRIADVLKDANAEFEFRKITSYMTGQDEAGAQLAHEERGKCFALLYQGEDAIEKIRQRLGATNPEEAEDGTVRSIYGYDLMKNGAHASDSVESAERERKIVGLWQESDSCEFRDMLEKYLATPQETS